MSFVILSINLSMLAVAKALMSFIDHCIRGSDGELCFNER